MSLVLIGEMLYGFRNGSRFERNASELRSFLKNPYVSLVPVAPITADRNSRIAAGTRAKGTPIPTNDVWIAAHAMETGADLVFADRHFEVVDGIVWLELDNHWHSLHLNQWRKKRPRERRSLACGAAIRHRTQNVLMCEGYLPEHRLQQGMEHRLRPGTQERDGRHHTGV